MRASSKIVSQRNITYEYLLEINTRTFQVFIYLKVAKYHKYVPLTINANDKCKRVSCKVQMVSRE